MAKGKHAKKATVKTAVTAGVTPVTAAAPVPTAVTVPAPAKAAVVPLGESAAPRKLTVSREAIAQRAFELFRARGGQHGHAMRDWLQAEAELGLGKQ